MRAEGGRARRSHVSCVRKEGPRYARAARAPESSDVLGDLPAARAARPRAGGRGGAARPDTRSGSSTCRSSDHAEYFRELDDSRPEAVGFSLNYLANVPEVVDLAKVTRLRFAGLLRLRRRAQRVVHRGRDPASTPTARSTASCAARARTSPRGCSRRRRATAPGSTRSPGRGARSPATGPRRACVDEPRRPRSRRASCWRGAASTSSACSIRAPRSSSPAAARGTARSAAPGRSTAAATARCSPETAAEDLARASTSPASSSWTTSPSSTPEHGYAIAEEVERRRIRKQYYLETRGDVLLRNQEVFRVLEAARAPVHVPRPRGHRRGRS